VIGPQGYAFGVQALLKKCNAKAAQNHTRTPPQIQPTQSPYLLLAQQLFHVVVVALAVVRHLARQRVGQLLEALGHALGQRLDALVDVLELLLDLLDFLHLALVVRKGRVFVAAKQAL
jgi:hypothetical protein